MLLNYYFGIKTVSTVSLAMVDIIFILVICGGIYLRVRHNNDALVIITVAWLLTDIVVGFNKYKSFKLHRIEDAFVHPAYKYIYIYAVTLILTALYMNVSTSTVDDGGHTISCELLIMCVVPCLVGMACYATNW